MFFEKRLNQRMYKNENERSKAEIIANTNPLSLTSLVTSGVMLLFTAPSLSIVVFLRRKFGVRFMPLWLMALALGLLWSVFSFHAGASWTSPTPARVFGVAMMGLAVWHSRTAWHRFWASATNPKLLWHTMSDGVPYLRSLFPAMNERFLKTVVEPGAAAAGAIMCFIIAYAKVKLTTAIDIDAGWGWTFMGYWLALAAVCHALNETLLYQQRLASFMDDIDRHIEAGVAMEMSRKIQTGQPAASVEDTLGNPVLFTPELFNIMDAARRKAEEAEKDEGEGTAAAA